MAWSVRYYRNARGAVPVATFFAVPSSIGITKQEAAKFLSRLELVKEHGLALVARQSDVLESLKGEDNLFSLRLKTTNNPRVLACALPDHQCIVLLHAFKKKKESDYRTVISQARVCRDLVVQEPARWVVAR